MAVCAGAQDAFTPTGIGRQGTSRPTRAEPEEGHCERAAQRSKRRGYEIKEQWMPAGREVLEVLQDSGIDPTAADDPHATPATVARHSEGSRPRVGDEMFKSSWEAGSH